ncbi:hypothetical protein ARAM_007442, partial [Aspergillus rambellii]
TGACECTGLLGPALGGGHGFLQGWYGLMVDQFVSMDLVLANGTLITLDEDSDLWWAVKGAGHNFGIVTSVTMKVYDVPHDGLWSYQSFIFTHEKVEQLYETINEVLLQDGNQPVDLINYSVFLNLPDLDPDHSVILFAIFREGVPAVEDKYTKPFIEIGPIVTSGDKGTYHDIPTWSGFAIDSPVCMKTGLASMRFPVDLQRYNPLVQRATYDIFSSVTHQNPALNNSMFLWEGYSLQGVQSIPAESTAYPNRAGNLLVSPVITYEPSVHHGSGQKELYAYVNYAFGDEGPRSWYGYEPWRLDRLRELKAKSLVYEFELYRSTDPSEESACNFAYPAPLAIFHRQCTPMGTVQPLLDFVLHSEIPEFRVCPTCFECFFNHTSWKPHLVRVADGTFNGTQQWTCDLAIPFLQRAVITALAGTGDFGTFADEAKARMAAPSWPGPGNAITKFLAQIPKVVFTGRDNRGGNIGKVTCDLAHDYSKLAMEVAVRRGNEGIWRECMKTTANVGVCPGPKGIDEREMRAMPGWYHVSGFENVQVCVSCYWLKVQLYGGGHLFKPLTRPLVPGVIRKCSLSECNAAGVCSIDTGNDSSGTLSWRARRLFNALRAGYETNQWASVLEVARQIVQEPPPCEGQSRAFTRASGRKWFGCQGSSGSSNDCTIIVCEDCHWRLVRGRPHAALFSYDLTEAAYITGGSSGFKCQTYTHRTQQRLQAAAETGDFQSFACWWNKRDELRKKRDAWIPLIQAEQMKQSAADSQRIQQARLRMNAQRNALSRIGATGLVDLAMGEPGPCLPYRLDGDTGLKGRTEAQQSWQDARNIPIQVGGAQSWELQRLYRLAKADEDAFLLME